MRSTNDAAAGGTLVNKAEDKGHNLIEEMAFNHFQWSSEIAQPKWVGDKLELDAISMVSSKVDAMS